MERLDELRRPRNFHEVPASGLSQYVGVFIPGGQAPMIDLMGSHGSWAGAKGKPNADESLKKTFLNL